MNIEGKYDVVCVIKDMDDPACPVIDVRTYRNVEAVDLDLKCLKHLKEKDRKGWKVSVEMLDLRTYKIIRFFDGNDLN